MCSENRASRSRPEDCRRRDRHHQQGATAPRCHREREEPPLGSSSCDRHRRRRRKSLRRARHHGVEYPPNYAVNTVPEHTFALIFALRRSITAYRDAVMKGRWQEAGQFCFFDYPVRDLAGSTLGIVGDGVLGQRVAALGRAFGMNVIFSTYKGVDGMGPLYTRIRRSYAQKRCNHSPLPAHAVDKEHDCGPRVRIDGTPSVAYQYRTRRACR